MADPTETVAAPGPATGPGAGRSSPDSTGRTGVVRGAAARGLGAAARYLGVVPFGVYVTLGLIIPLVAVAVGAFTDSDTGAFTMSNVNTALHGAYLAGFEHSLILSMVTSVIPGIAGLLIAYAIFTARRARTLRQIVITASGVFANFGGVPLAFLFITTLGSSGLETRWLSDLGFNPYAHGFSLYSMLGIEIVYGYFQIPLMVLVTLPALEGLRPAWREAAENLGARTWSYWRYVGGPVLLPPFLGSVLLLFGFALSAYATANALTSGTVPITSLQIGQVMSGNVITGSVNVGKALGLGMVVVIAVIMTCYVLLQRRAAKWLR